MAEHTLGPYIVDEMSDAFTIRQERTNRELALIIRRGTTERLWVEEEANAKLFAAAPELLAALEELLDNLHTVAGCECSKCTAILAAQVAIAQARGDSDGS